MADPNCPNCNGTGFRIIERAGLTAAAKCECGAEDRAARIYQAANIPPKFENATLDNFMLPHDNPIASSQLGTAVRRVHEFVRQYPSGPYLGLLLLGDPGIGKTHLAIGVMKALIAKGHECVFFNYQTLINQIRKEWNPLTATGGRTAYDAAMQAEVLVLDDLGARRSDDWVQDTFEDIISHRYDHKKSMVATTNLPDPDVSGRTGEAGIGIVPRRTLAEAIGMRARSRLFEMCRIVRMPLVEDHRVKHGTIDKL